MIALDTDLLMEIVKILPATIGKLAQTCREMCARMKYILAAVDARKIVVKFDPKVSSDELWALDISHFEVVYGKSILHGMTRTQSVDRYIVTSEINFTCGIAFGQWRMTYDPLPLRAKSQAYYVNTGYFGVKSMPHELIFARKYTPDGKLKSIKMQFAGTGYSSGKPTQPTTVLTVRPQCVNSVVLSDSRNAKIQIPIESITDEFLRIDHPPIPAGLKSEWEMIYDMLPDDTYRLIESDTNYLYASDGNPLDDLIEFWSDDEYSDEYSSDVDSVSA